MAIRDWSMRRIQWTWVVGAALEALLILAPGWHGQRMERRAIARADIETAHPASRTLGPAERDSVFRVLADSLRTRRASHSDTLAGVALGRLYQGVVMTILLLALALYLPIPLALVLLTILWRRAHRPAPSESVL